MGVAVGLGAPGVTLIHAGLRLMPDEDQGVASFSAEVEEGYSESWIDGMDVYHNPNALHPLNSDSLPGAAHHRLTEHGLETMAPYGHLLRSRMAIVTTKSDT